MTTQQTPNREAVARRAYELYLKRNGQHGSHESDWLQAEAELRGANGGNGGSKAASSKPSVVDSVLETSSNRQPARSRMKPAQSARK